MNFKKFVRSLNNSRFCMFRIYPIFRIYCKNVNNRRNHRIDYFFIEYLKICHLKLFLMIDKENS